MPCKFVAKNTFQPKQCFAPGALYPSFGLVLELIWIVALLIISASWLAGGTYNPFIY